MSSSKNAAVTINVIANAIKAKLGFKEAEKGAQSLKGEVGKLSDQFLGKMGLQAGIAGAVAYAQKAAGEFIDLAKKSADLGKAWGTSTELASRWIAVADDMGVEADALTGAFKNINKNVTSDVWKKYGIEVQAAGGYQRDANEILLDTLDTLNNMSNPTERARAGTELFGKAWGGVAPLVGKSREEYQKMLETVAKGQVITDAEAAKAEKMRIAQDNLADAFKNVELSVGQLVGALGPLVDYFAGKITDLGNTLAALFGQDTGGVSEVTNNLDAFFATSGDAERMGDAMIYLQQGMQNLHGTWENVVDYMGGDTTKAIDNAKKAFDQLLKDNPQKAKMFAQFIKDYAGYASDPTVSQEVRDQASAWAEQSGTIDGWIVAADGAITDQEVINRLQKESTDMMDGLIGAWETYLGLLDTDQAIENAKNALIELAFAVDDPTTAVDEYAAAQRQAARDTAAFIKAAGDVPQEVQTKMLADIDEGNLAAVYQVIDTYGKDNPVTIPMDIQLQSSNMDTYFKGLEADMAAVYTQYYRSRIGYTPATPTEPKRAVGGPVMGGTTYLVGEKGPELFTTNTSGSIIPNGAFGGGGGYGGGDTSIVVNLPAGANGDDVVRALQRWVRANGQLPLPVSSKTVR